MNDIASRLPAIGAPATRALASLGVTHLEQLTEHSEGELLDLHGFGPRALEIVKAALQRDGRQLRT